MDALWQDVRYACRTLASRPGFTAVGIFVLALAIAVNTAIFSLVNALIFVKPDVPRAGELRYIYGIDTGDPQRTPFTMHRELTALRTFDRAFEHTAGYMATSTYLKEGGARRLLRGEAVTANYFDVLEIATQIGRTFSADDDRVESHPVAIISDSLWRNHFNAAPDIVGRTLPIDPEQRTYGQARLYTIVGVAPSNFHGMARFFETHFWIPRTPKVLDIIQYRKWESPNSRQPVDPLNTYPVNIVMRKPSNVSDAHLQAVVGQAAIRFRSARISEGTNPAGAERWTLEITPSRRNRLPFDSTGRIVPTRLAAGLLAAAGAVLLIALANLAAMLSARGVVRRTEMAVRATLGAVSWRLARQLLVESLLIAAAGGLLGFAAARAMISLLLAAVPRIAAAGYSEPFLLDVPTDWRVLAYTAAACIASACLVTLAPVRQALSRDLLARLSGGSAASSGRWSMRLRQWVIVPQVCVSLMLVVVAGLLVGSLLREEISHRGYDSTGVVAVEFQLQMPPYYRMTPAERQEQLAWRERTVRRILDRAQTVAGVESAALSGTANGVPLSLFGSSVVDRDRFSADPPVHGTRRMAVSDEYFDVMRIPLIDGRLFDIQDTRTSPKVAIVDQSLAWNLWGGASPVGRYIAFYRKGDTRAPIWLEVIGVVGSVAAPLTEGSRFSMVYTPALQDEAAFTNAVIARVQGEPASVLRNLKEAVGAIDEHAFVWQARVVDDTLASLLFPRRASAAILGSAGLAALFLAGIGLYGVVSFSVAQRVREIGIRAALGADRRAVVRLILRDGIRVIAAGTALGGILAYVAVKLTSARVVALPEADIVTLSVGPLILALAMLLATYIPARRAASVDPMVALRRL